MRTNNKKKNSIMYSINSLLMLVMLTGIVRGDVSLDVFSFDEGEDNVNLSKPRIYLHNTGTQPISNLVYYYYFTTENGLVPVIEDYYTPNEDITLEHLDGAVYRIKYTLNRTLNVGEILPNSSGNVIGIHYNNFEPVDKSNDYSYNGSSTFVKNEKISVYSNGILIYGNGYSGGDDTVNTPSPDQMRLQSFAIYSTEISNVKDHCVFTGGGAVGSNGYVEIGSQDSIYGNIVSGGNVKLRSQSRIFGNVMAGNAIIKEDSTYYVSGSQTGNVSVGMISLPVRSITPGYTNVSIYRDSTLAPGIYGNISINSDCTMRMTAGNYVFNNFHMSDRSDIVFDITPEQKIDMQIQGEMHISNDATMTFSGFAYAPSVQIYTNDPNTIYIGNDATLSGIITAPLAVVNIYNRVRCEGAVYARQITIEPNSVIRSTLVDPEGDADGDKVSNRIEVEIGRTDPTDISSFIDIVIPSVTTIDYSIANDITLDFATFYGSSYSKSDTVPFHIDANVFNGDLAPLLQIRTPGGGGGIPQIPGYTPVGLSLSFYYFPIDSSKEITIPVPYTDDQIVDGTEALLIIHNDGTHEIVQPEAVETGYLTVRVDKSVKSVTMMQKMGASGSAVAYLDGGMIYSSSNGSSLRMNVSLRNCTVTQAENAVMQVYYTDNSDPINPKDTFSVFTLDTISKNGVYTLINTKTIDFTGSFRVTKLTLSVPGYPITYQNDTVNCIVNRGQQLSINIDTDIDDFNSMAEPVTTSYGLNYELESVSIDGDGRIMQERTGDSIKYRYDYYLKDHLGSTRMVFNDQQTVTEQINYQAYGTIQPLDSAAPSLPAREKFTGKEYDVQGADFARVEYDIAVNGFTRRSGSSVGSLRVTYKDIATGSMYQKVYSCRVDSNGNTLRFTGSESFNSNIEIERIRLTAYGATYTISNSIPFDSLIVNTGKTRRVEMSVTSGEITSAPVDSNFYTLAADEDNTEYFSGTKLFYFGARYYDPELGVWLSVDPDSQFTNLYGYSTNPIIMVDPDGKSVIAAIIIGVAAGLGAYNGHKIAKAAGKTGFESFLYTLGGAVIGGTAGAVGGAIAGAAGLATPTAASTLGEFAAYGLVAGGGAGAYAGAANGLMKGIANDYNLGQIFTSMFTDGASGMMTGAMFGLATSSATCGVLKVIQALRNTRINIPTLSEDAHNATNEIVSQSIEQPAADIKEGLERASIPDQLKKPPHVPLKTDPNLSTTKVDMPSISNYKPELPVIPQQQGKVIVPGSHGTNMHVLNIQNFDTNRNIMIFTFDPITF